MGVPTFVLASASPARKRLLQNAGIEPVVCQSDFDESQVQLSEPVALVETLALHKAQTVASQFSDALVLGCDSVLSVRGEIHGKPADPEEAIARWQLMRGTVGELYTGHALIDLSQDKTIVRCGITRVYFADVSDKRSLLTLPPVNPSNVLAASPWKVEGDFLLKNWKVATAMSLVLAYRSCARC
jgi:septum formation protein